MKQSKLKLEIQRRRCFSEEFKKARVKDLIEKRITILEITKLYEVSRVSVYKWLYKYSVFHKRQCTLVVQMDSEAHINKQLMQRMAELERIIGQKQMEIDFLNKLIELGSEDLGFDLKKNFSTRALNGSDTGGQPTATE